MNPAPTSPPSSAPPQRGGTSAERLKALWQLSSDQTLADDARIRAMLAMAADTLDMELAVLGHFGQDYTVHYRHDDIGIVSEGMVMALQDSMCLAVYHSAVAAHIPDLSLHPTLNQHVMVTGAGMRVYSALPVLTAGRFEWVLAFMRRRIAPAVSADDIVYMELVADWLGNALHQAEQKRQLERLALTDSLTGLANRRAAEERLQHEISRVRRTQGGFALALADLDHFKRINDRYGHAVGDAVLTEIAQRLQTGLRDGDWVARWGGEEFLFFLHDCDVAEAIRIVERAAATTRATPVTTTVGPLALTLSAGIGTVQPGQYDALQALDLADVSLRQAKNAGRDRVHAVLDSSAGWSLHTVKHAVQNNQLRLATQIIVDLQTGVAVADESLTRLMTDAGQIVIADEFIGMAEGLGLIAELDRHMAQLSIQRCLSRIQQGHALGFSHFLNLSPQFLARRDLVDELLQQARASCAACCASELSVKPFVLEITERQRIDNLDVLRSDLQPLIDFGFRLALDDFGSGYSSYMYLAQLPISFLKIEGTLVRNISTNPRYAAIVESIARFASKEGIRTVAEHVEDAETARILREMGVDWAQGWHFGRAVCE
jgi:diguanylate cyclase (GGDEF)-like protein